ncbi:MAG: hypothetical protein BWK80_13485 [Desulfobacteraceae bacterium IS3]|nr:MAG: hypothetical protein BWK80_13485 [Desulfobacteraceae bacterium IS3]
MLHEIERLTENYFRWLKDKTMLKQLHDWVEITTPFLDRHNDYIQIYIKKKQEQFVLSDDGYTIADLEQSGCSLESEKRKRILQMTLNGFGVLQKESELTVYATHENFSLKKHNLIQAILSVNDLFYLASSSIANLFLEDVTAWLDSNDIRYLPQIKLTGDSLYDHIFHFAIPKSKKAPERLLRAMSKPGRDSTESFAFAWLDTKKVRRKDTSAFAILNDQEQKISPAVMDALNKYSIIPVPWEKRDNFIDKLAA